MNNIAAHAQLKSFKVVLQSEGVPFYFYISLYFRFWQCLNMVSLLPVMVSFGAAGVLRNFQFCEVEGSRTLGDLLSLFGPDGWSSCSWNEVIIKLSTTKLGGLDKFSLNNSVDLVLRILKADVLWLVFENPPLIGRNAFDLLKQAQTAKVLPSTIEKPINQKQELRNILFI